MRSDCFHWLCLFIHAAGRAHAVSAATRQRRFVAFAGAWARLRACDKPAAKRLDWQAGVGLVDGVGRTWDVI